MKSTTKPLLKTELEKKNYAIINIDRIPGCSAIDSMNYSKCEFYPRKSHEW